MSARALLREVRRRRLRAMMVGGYVPYPLPEELEAQRELAEEGLKKMDMVIRLLKSAGMEHEGGFALRLRERMERRLRWIRSRAVA